MIEGLDVKKSEIHGMAMRGGPVFSHVRFGQLVFAPVISQGEANVLFSLESMEVLRWAKWAHADAAVCYLAHHITPTGIEIYPEGIDREISMSFKRTVCLDPVLLKQRMDSPKTENTALLGALSPLVPLKEDSFLSAIEKNCPSGTIEMNTNAFRIGRQITLEQKLELPHVE